MFATVDEVGRVCAEERIDAGWTKGGTIVLARTPLQLDRALAAVDRARDWGFREGRLPLALRTRGAGTAASGTSSLGQMFPVLAGVEFTHAWGGPLGIARDWWASVSMDRSTRLGWRPSVIARTFSRLIAG